MQILRNEVWPPFFLCPNYEFVHERTKMVICELLAICKPRITAFRYPKVNNREVPDLYVGFLKHGFL